MHVSFSPLQVVSRILSVLLLAAPLASESFAAHYFQLLVVTLLFLALVEGLAFLLRLAARAYCPGAHPMPRFSEVPPYVPVS